MATPIELRHPETGVRKTGYSGFSWTTLFFGPFPALFRGDLITFVLALLALAILSFVVGAFAPLLWIVWAAFYNEYYTNRLLERGYRTVDNLQREERAASQAAAQAAAAVAAQAAVAAAAPMPPALPTLADTDRDLSNDTYRIYLTKKHATEFNAVLGKHTFNGKLFDSVDELLAALHAAEESERRKLSQDMALGKMTIDQALAFLQANGYSITKKSNCYEAVSSVNKSYLYSDGDVIGLAKSLTLSKLNSAAAETT